MHNIIVFKVISKLKQNDGYTTLILPIILSVILAFVAFTLELGQAFILKHELQAAADAAAISGASNVQVEYAVDEFSGEIDLNTTVLKINPSAADAEAEYYFGLNIGSLGLSEKGVEIVESIGQTKDDEIHYSYEVTATIPTPLTGNILGSGSSRNVRVYSEAMVEQE